MKNTTSCLKRKFRNLQKINKAARSSLKLDEHQGDIIHLPQYLLFKPVMIYMKGFGTKFPLMLNWLLIFLLSA